MKETGIIMSGNHPKLILDGIKTQTRRVLKPQPDLGLDKFEQYHQIEVGKYHPSLVDKNGDMYPGDEIFGAYTDDGEWGWKCPYGQVGDRLWVRETHKYFNSYMLGDHREDVQIVEFKDGVCRDISEKLDPDWWETHKLGKWRSARFLHKWASRITLEITEVRVERVQEITFDDVYREGIPRWLGSRPLFIKLWDSLNAKRGYGWEVNPWVWCISFKK